MIRAYLSLKYFFYHKIQIIKYFFYSMIIPYFVYLIGFVVIISRIIKEMTFDIQIYVFIVIFSCTGKAISSKELIVRGKIPTVDPPYFLI